MQKLNVSVCLCREMRGEEEEEAEDGGCIVVVWKANAPNEAF